MKISTERFKAIPLDALGWSNLHEIGAQFENREVAPPAPSKPADKPSPKSTDG